MFSVRVPLAILLLVVVATILWLDDLTGNGSVFVIAAALLAARVLHEFCAVTGVTSRSLRTIAIVAITLLAGAFWADHTQPAELAFARGQLTAAGICLLLLALCTCVLLIGDPPPDRSRPVRHSAVDLAWICTGLVLVALAIGYLCAIRLTLAPQLGVPAALAARAGILLAGFVIVVTKAADMGGYLIGKPFGRHKLLTPISPHKSWEGTFGGITASITVAMVLAPALILPEPLAPWRAALLGAVIGSLALIGDLTESYIKRWGMVKHSDALIPSYGGLLDLIDSLIFCAPTSYYFLLWMH
jgi:phosphatidate cytidylyltransferase